MFFKLVFTIFILSCNNSAITPLTLENVNLEISYKDCLLTIEKSRIDFKNQYSQGNSEKKQEVLDSVSIYLENTIVETIIPYWYGTPWDFNGHTNVPNQGEIACGYLVSTTLKHVGFNLNRYKFAQQPAMSEAKTLQSTPLKIYRNKSKSELVSKVLSELQDGLYLVGLDNHVGYLQIKNKEVFFIHANYCTNKVEKEQAETSACFTSSIYALGEISTNKELLKKWILGTTIPIHMD